MAITFGFTKTVKPARRFRFSEGVGGGRVVVAPVMPEPVAVSSGTVVPDSKGFGFQPNVIASIASSRAAMMAPPSSRRPSGDRDCRLRPPTIGGRGFEGRIWIGPRSGLGVAG